MCLPLQAVLELLFAQLREQQGSIERAAAERAVLAGHLTAALQQLEARVQHLAGGVQEVQQASAEAQHANADTSARLAAVELQLDGTDNLAGRGEFTGSADTRESAL